MIIVESQSFTERFVTAFQSVPVPLVLTFAGVTLTCIGFLWFLLSRIRKRFGSANGNSMLLVEAVRTVVDSTFPSTIVLLSVLVGLSSVGLSADANRYLFLALIALGIVQIAHWLSQVSLVWLKSNLGNSQHSSLHSALGLISFATRLVIWSLAFVVLLSNLGVDVTALVAGLGIGGVAVAFALQNILSDLFASLSIVLDRPFEVGDFIIVGDVQGNVEHIGVKTTKIRSLSGEQILLANSDLLGSRIRNFKRMRERRVVFNVGIVYETPREKVAQVPTWIKDIILTDPLARYDRAHFRSFGDFSLNIEVVYFVLSAEFLIYMETQQSMNLKIMDKFAAEGVEFAYPTQVVHVTGSPATDTNQSEVSNAA